MKPADIPISLKGGTSRSGLGVTILILLFDIDGTYKCFAEIEEMLAEWDVTSKENRISFYCGYRLAGNNPVDAAMLYPGLGCHYV